MIEPTKGEKLVIMGLTCYLPEPPPLYEIRGSHLPPEEQKWSRIELPQVQVRDIEIFSGERFKSSEYLDWEVARREEEIKRTGRDPWDLDGHGRPKLVAGVEADPTFEFDVLKNFRRSELQKCDPWDGGDWIMINGKPIYITPFHRFYINWWKLNTGYPEWRWTDALRYYHWQYVWEEENCLGRTEASKRGDGKTYRGTGIQYLATIYQKNCHSGIQSKTDDDAEEVFKIKMVEPYKDLPDFFVPINSNSTDPQGSLQFFAPAKKGRDSSIHRMEQKNAIRSQITYRNSQAIAYDGSTIDGVFFRDEEGKTEKVDVMERHGVTRDCVYRDGRVVGKIYSTTTVAEMNKGGEAYKLLWDDSNPEERNELGETRSGIYKFFLPAYMTEYQDEFGFPDEAKGRRVQSARRKALEGNPIAYQKYVLQYPWSEEELFLSLGSNCQYNFRILQERQKIVLDPNFQHKIRKGRFVFVAGNIHPNSVEWQDDENGEWHVSDLLLGKQLNVKTYERGGRTLHRPGNAEWIVGGFDPTKTSANPDKRRSKAAGVIHVKENFWDEFGQWSNNAIADFVYQPENPEEAYIRFLAGCMWFGCPFLPESNLGISPVLEANGCADFLMARPERTYKDEKKIRAEELGLPATEWSNDLLLKNKQAWMASGEPQNASRLNLPRIIASSISFDPKYRTKHDLEVAHQLALMAATKRVASERKTIDLGDMFMGFDNNSSYGTIR